MKFLNVCGTNGSGKTTLLRSFVKAMGVIPNVVPISVPNHPPIPVTYTEDPTGTKVIAVLGDYSPGATGTTAGCDRIKTQQAIKDALLGIVNRDLAVPVSLVLFEGVLVSTIFGPWLEWERANGGMVRAFLDTPLDVCLARIQQRNGGKPIKEDLVADKHKTIEGVRKKVLNAYPGGGRVVTLRWDRALKDLKETALGMIE